jgi:hypothetical protein
VTAYPAEFDAWQQSPKDDLLARRKEDALAAAAQRLGILPTRLHAMWVEQWKQRRRR